jgi:hypothetical protein
MLKNRLGWSYEPKTPFFISLVAIGVIVAIAAGCFLTYRYSISDKRDRETITFGVSVLGASIAIYGLLSAADSVRRSNAEKFASVSIAFVQRWNSPSYLTLKTAWRKLNKEMDDIKDDALRDALLRDDVEKRSNAVEVLNFFEEMATGINSGSVDDKLLRRYFEIVVVRAFERYEPWIRQHRIRKAAPGFYDELEELAHEWKKPESKR